MRRGKVAANFKYLRTLLMGRDRGYCMRSFALRFDRADKPLLSALTRGLQSKLPQSPISMHLKGNGGLKGAVRAAVSRIKQANRALYVYRTDVKSFYESIDADILLQKVERYITDRQLINLLNQYLHMSVEDGGNFYDAPPGLRAGGAPSPVLGGFYLYELDCAFEDHPHVFYIRYMDDILVLSPTRWHLRKAIKTIQTHFSALGLKSHPDKTIIGRMGHGALKDGVDFLGYRLSPNGLSLNDQAKQRHIEKSRRLYEQCKRRQKLARRLFADGENIAPFAPEWLKRCAYINLTPEMSKPTYIMDRLRAYEKRFLAWANGGLSQCSISLDY